jgi:hypothetical protein
MEYPSNCPRCNAPIPPPYGMNLYESMEGGLVCYKCMAKETVENNLRRIRELERENADLRRALEDP